MSRYPKTKIVIGMICLILILSVPAVSYAGVKTGGISIQLSCFEENDTGKRTVFTGKGELVPREQVSYVISVTNTGADAWIRLKMEFLWEEWMSYDAELWIQGIDVSWKKAGEYWYYTKPFKAGEQIDFCKGFQVPDFIELPKEVTFRICSVAEAVQAANVIPDFTSTDPFSGMSIGTVAELSGFPDAPDGFQVICEPNADGIVIAERLFSDVEMLMPGDEFRDVLTIQNNNPYDIQVSVKEQGQAVAEHLRNTLNLTIQRGETVLYDGPLTDDALHNGLMLGRYAKHSTEELEWILSLSSKAGNETAFQYMDLTLIFSVEKVKETSGGGGIADQHLHEHMMYPYPDPSVKQAYSTGTWKLVDEGYHRWEYYFADGCHAKDGWLYLYNPYSPDQDKNGWFCFNKKGIMQYGWIKTKNDNWYFCHEISDGNLGRLKKGWHHDQDDTRVYYLDPITGIMQTGWREIEETYYYFTPLDQTYRQNWFWNTTFGRWIYDFLGYRTYGSMYKEERTPDGYLVGADGAWIEE